MIFLCSKRSSIFDLPENRVLLFLLGRVFKIAQSLSLLDFDSVNFDADNIKVQKWINKVEAEGYHTAKLLRNPFIREIGEVYELTNKLIEDTERARAIWYKDLADVAKVYSSSVNVPITFLKRSLANKVFEPLNKDT